MGLLPLYFLIILVREPSLDVGIWRRQTTDSDVTKRVNHLCTSQWRHDIEPILV